MTPPSLSSASQIAQGWMNEIHSYDPEMYHATLTHSVYVRLEGSVLRLSKPNRNISRRAAHNETKPDVTYISQKIYDLTDSKVQWPASPSLMLKDGKMQKCYVSCVSVPAWENARAK